MIYCWCFISHPQCYRQLLYWAPPCITLKIRIWVVAYFFNFFKKKKIIKAILCNFSMRMLKCFFFFNFAHKKLKKTTLKSCSDILKNNSELPKRPKYKNSCFKMWFTDQLYINWVAKVTYIMDENNVFFLFDRTCLPRKVRGKRNTIFLYLLLTPAKKRACSLIIFTLSANFHVLNKLKIIF